MDRDDQILSYIQDRLSPDARQAFEQSMAADPALASEVDVLLAARRLSAQSDTEALPSDGWHRLSASIDAEDQPPANENRAPWATLAKAASIAALSIGIWQFAIYPRISAPPPDTFTPASQSLTAPALQVIFTPEARTADVSELIYEIGGTIVDGPGAIGLYRIAFEDQTSRAAAQTALAQRPDLVSSVTLE